MTTRLNFLQSILPPDGVYVAVAIDEGKTRQTFHESVEDLNERLDTLRDTHVNAYFALASFNTDSSRTADNVKHLRCFYLDLDCGVDPEGKKHETQADALAALKTFVKEMQLPKPTVVNSGRGIHVYWPLTEPVARLPWKAVAEKFKAMCAMKDLKADPSVTADAARVLRAPDTLHVKDKDNPLSVHILMTGQVTPFDTFRQLLGVTEFDISAAQVAKRPMDEVTKNLIANRPSWFKDILKKSVEGTGCNQILYAAGNQEKIDEPHWRAVLSIASHCADRDKAIHKISNQHPEYDPDVTERKAAATKGPYTCASFQKIDDTLCEGCPHAGKITSPIVLGMGRVLEASPDDSKVEVVREIDGVVEKTVYEVPPYPTPYFRGMNGGVYVRKKVKDEEGKMVDTDLLVYEYDFYSMSIINDPHEGMSSLFRVHLPQDGVREFCIPCREVLTKDKFRDHLADEGVIPSHNKQMDELMSYVNHYIKTYQREKKAKVARVQFGWADNFSCFVVGDREIRPSEIVYSPPSASTVRTAPKFRKRGTLEAWQEVAKFYTTPGQEVPFFALMAGFAAPLMSILEVQGGIISLYSPEGGTGKSTTLHMINSIFGHPKEAMLIADDTGNSRIHRLGVINNIAATIDEITNESPESISAAIFAMLQGRGKERMNSSSNTERLNTTKWNNISVVTGNSVISEKLYLIKKMPDGELRRVLEFPFPKPKGLAKSATDTVFRPLYENYGIAGEAYIQYLLKHFDRIRSNFLKIQRKMDEAAGLSQREQIWSDTVAGILLASLFVKDSGIIPITNERLKSFYEWCVAWLKDNKAKAAQDYVDPEETLGAFMSDHHNDTLIINGTPKHPGMPEAPLKEPRGKLLIRYEPDTKELCINSAKFREFCARQQISYAHMIEGLRQLGKFQDITKKRMGKGTAISANERVLVLKNINIDFVKDAVSGNNARNAS